MLSQHPERDGPPRVPLPTARFYRLAEELKRESRGSANVASTVQALADDIERDFGHSLRVDLPLDCGANLRMLMHPWGEHRWLFQHQYISRRERLDVDVVCEWQCLVDYRQGVLQPWLDLSMNIIIPERLGKVYIYGADISPGAKTYLCFKYEMHTDGTFRLQTVQRGARDVMSFKDTWAAVDKAPADQLMLASGKLPEPFRVPMRITREHSEPILEDGKPVGFQWLGDFKVEFPLWDEDKQDGVVGTITFPATLRR